MPSAAKDGKRKFSDKFKKTFHISTNHKKPISSPESTPEPSMRSEGWVVAVTDNSSVDSTDEFKRGDILHLETMEYERWWIAKNSRTGKSIRIFDEWFSDRPGESVAFDAWQNIDREEATKQLLVPELHLGTYILRPGSDPKCYVLCVLYKLGEELDVKFYQIHTTDDRMRYYMQPEHMFPSLDELLEFYSDPDLEQSCRLCYPLAGPRAKKSSLKKEFGSKNISRHLLEWKKDLGFGNYGRVYLASFRNTLVAVKEALGPQTTKESIDEAKLLSQLCHPRILCLLGICCEPNTEPLLIITEFMPKGSLLDFLKTAEGKAFSVDDLIKIISQICEGMAYLEEHKVVHNDLRAANVLVDKNNSVRVADFGLAKILRCDSRDINTGLFPVRWTAPEATAVNYRANSSADVWSFGVLMYEILSYGGLPYAEISDNEILEYLASGRRLGNPCHPEWKQSTSLYNVMLRCWDVQPECRPAFANLKLEELFLTEP